MAGMSDYLENQIIDHIFRGATYGKPAGIHLALFTAAPTDAGGGTEVAGGAYARVDMVQGDTTNVGTGGETTAVASAGTSGQTSNANILTFPAPTANWGSISAIGVFDAAAAGNLLFWVSLATPKTVNNGDPAPKFLANALTTTLA